MEKETKNIKVGLLVKTLSNKKMAENLWKELQKTLKEI